MVVVNYSFMLRLAAAFLVFRQLIAIPQLDAGAVEARPSQGLQTPPSRATCFVLRNPLANFFQFMLRECQRIGRLRILLRSLEPTK
jgi:hypothetical protein